MNSSRLAVLALLFSSLSGSSFAAEEAFKLEEGFVSLFNGTNLSGWGYRARAARGAAPARSAEDFAGKTASSDGRFTAADGIITVHVFVPPTAASSNAPVVTPPAANPSAVPPGTASGNAAPPPAPGGRGAGGGGRPPGQITGIWTQQTFPKDFILRLEFRASVNADSGIFIRQTQLQCRDYLVAGPYTELKKYKPQDWNEIEVVVTGSVARCTCNGELLEAALAVPATGSIGLEGDWGSMEYRRIRIKEL